MTSSRQSRISALPAHLREQLRRRLSGRSEQPDRIALAPRTGPLPLSFAQQRLWFLHEFQPGGAEYNSALPLRLVGPLDVAALTAALRVLPARHESLRTTFDGVDGKGVQLVHPAHDLPVPLVDLSGSSGPGLDGLDRVLFEEYSRAFDLRRGPLFRALLVRLSECEHVLLLTAHHIVTDGWSMGVLTDELGALYEAALRGEEVALPPPPLQYGDYAVWQRTRPPDSALDGQLDYWKRQLAGISPLELPTDRTRPAVRSSAGATHDFLVPAQVTARLGELVRAADTTLFTVLVAACQALFARYAGQDDVAVGTVVSGRNRPELERTVGFFVNTMVLRAHVDVSRTFSEFLGSVKNTVLDAFAHDEAPFERLVDALHAERDVSRNPLFDVMVLVHNARRMPPTFGGLRVENVDVPRRAANFDITVEFHDSDGVLAGRLEYNTDLFDAATIERMVEHMQMLLDGIAAEPDRRLAELPMLLETERHQVLARWNDTDQEIPHGSLPVLFAAQAHRTPLATAVVCGEVSLSYRELDEQANHLAVQLIGLGVQPEDRVGVLMDRSVDLVVTVLAIVKAGGAYLPLDVRAPADRMKLVLAEAGASVLATDRVWETMAREVRRGHLVVGGGSSQADPGTEADVAVDPEQLAYVMYTSGSTGTPKGVAVRHRDVVALAFDRRYQGSAHQRVLLHSPQAFDASTYELWVPLLRGGQVVVAPPGDLDPVTLRQVISDHGVTGLWLTAGLFRLIAQDAPGCLAGVREVWTGGDVVAATAVRRTLDACPDLVVVDGYGPTETTTFATSYPMSATEPVPETIPIGHPLDNMQVYVLDGRLRPV
ncbi:MAG: non-ribosomal peptide synthetase, partial [Pseudonocardiaceae bacterium]